MKIMSETFIDMIASVVKFAQEQYEGAEQCHDKCHRIGVTPRLEKPHHIPLELRGVIFERYGDQQLRSRACPEFVADRAMILMLLEVILFL